MHPCFRRFVSAARQQGLEVIVRTNLVILLEDGFEDLPAWFAAHGIRLAASLPCYLETNVDRQRGRRVHARSIEALRRLNAVGYGSDAGPFLDLVYNPVGPTLPPDQTALERAYRQELHRGFGIRFNRLYTLTNLPIGRFLQDLERRDRAEAYAEVLRTSFNPRTIDGLMCRHQVHVGWDGTLHDCDFNFALGLEATVPRPNVHDFDPATFVRRRIRTGSHCFGCTAGCGSSCNGALA
jgi:radical SAM/Cys-rich protein